MALTTRSSKQASAPEAPARGDLEARVAELEANQALLARIAARLIVAISTGAHSATLRQIAVQEKRIASHAEVDMLERLCGGG